MFQSTNKGEKDVGERRDFFFILNPFNSLAQ